MDEAGHPPSASEEAGLILRSKQAQQHQRTGPTLPLLFHVDAEVGDDGSVRDSTSRQSRPHSRRGSTLASPAERNWERSAGRESTRAEKGKRETPGLVKWSRLDKSGDPVDLNRRIRWRWRRRPCVTAQTSPPSPTSRPCAELWMSTRTGNSPPLAAGRRRRHGDPAPLCTARIPS